MAQYIERAQANDALIDNTHLEGSDLEEAVNAICAVPAADVVQVRHGRWINHGWSTVCSECGEDYAFAKRNYCPNCGAKMDGAVNQPPERIKNDP